MIDKRVVIIGAGASGYFTAIRLKELNPSVDVLILEKTGKTLSKLRISGADVAMLPMIVKAYLRYYNITLGARLF